MTSEFDLDKERLAAALCIMEKPVKAQYGAVAIGMVGGVALFFLWQKTLILSAILIVAFCSLTPLASVLIARIAASIAFGLEDRSAIRRLEIAFDSCLALLSICACLNLAFVVLRGDWGIDVFVHQSILCGSVAAAFLLIKSFLRFR